MIWEMPYLRVGMYMRNLDIIYAMEKDREDEDKLKRDMEARRNKQLQSMGVN